MDLAAAAGLCALGLFALYGALTVTYQLWRLWRFLLWPNGGRRDRVR